jgi:hypothetical protein
MLLHLFYFVVWTLFYFDLVWKILFGIVWKQVNKEKKKKEDNLPSYLIGSKARRTACFFPAPALATEWAGPAAASARASAASAQLPSQPKPAAARFLFRFTDGWGQLVSALFYLAS